MKEPLLITHKDFDVLKYRLANKDLRYNSLIYSERMEEILKQIATLAKVPIRDLEEAYMKEVRDEYRFACFCISVTKALDFGSRYDWERIYMSGINVIKLWGLDFAIYILYTLLSCLSIFFVSIIFIPDNMLNIFVIVNILLWVFRIKFNVIDLAIMFQKDAERNLVKALTDKHLEVPDERTVDRV